MKNLDNIIAFFQDDSHWKELRFITPWIGSNEVFEVGSDISDRNFKSESVLPRCESLISRWAELLQERYGNQYASRFSRGPPETIDL